jgi:hypothetical protein
MSAGPAGCDAWRVARAERATAAKYPSIQLSKERKIRRKVYIHTVVADKTATAVRKLVSNYPITSSVSTYAESMNCTFMNIHDRKKKKILT